MTPDYDTLLLAIGLSALCLAATLFASWLSARLDRFLLSWSLGVGFTVPAVMVYSVYVERPDPLVGSLCFALQFTGFAFIYGAAYRFRTSRSARRRILAVFAVFVTTTLPFMLSGYNGIAFILFNLLLAACLVVTAREYWRGRAEAPLPLTGISLLYALTAASFFLCGAVLLHERAWVIAGAPDNWSEDLNLVVAIVGITGIGAMSLALNQWRIAANHRHAAMTDALTGLLNRRALFDRYGDGPVDAHTAVIAFDLDDFKTVNDRYGHAAGDAALRLFAGLLKENAPAAASAARLGGEEFTLILDRAPPDRATRIAETIRVAFAAQPIVVAGRTVTCTVSAGIAFCAREGTSFDSLLNAADKALYASKRDGRNRVSLSPEMRRSA